MKGRKLIPYAGKERGGDQRTYGHSSQRGVPKLPNGESKRQRRKLSRRGTVSRSLFALGPPTRGAFWDITAIPVIRRQSEILAQQLANLIREQVD
jgi:uncharacterized NAD(P)/FAD-binding protein YdhS